MRNDAKMIMYAGLYLDMPSRALLNQRLGFFLKQRPEYIPDWGKSKLMYGLVNPSHIEFHNFGGVPYTEVAHFYGTRLPKLGQEAFIKITGLGFSSKAFAASIEFDGMSKDYYDVLISEKKWKHMILSRNPNLQYSLTDGDMIPKDGKVFEIPLLNSITLKCHFGYGLSNGMFIASPESLSFLAHH